jgi:hypothetical protein
MCAGRKKFTGGVESRNMKEQPHWTNILTPAFFEENYVKQRLSYPKLREILLKDGYNVHIGTIHKYAKKLGFGRNASEAKRNRDPNPLDYTISYLDERTLEALDGFLLGDGCLQLNRTDTGVARCTCTLQYEEFSQWLMAPFERYQVHRCEANSPKSPSGKAYEAKTKFHPDLFKHRQRWYPDNQKQPPDDVRITPLSVMMWYLGDGSFVKGDNTVVLRLSTDGFSPERVEFLATKLREIGIACHRNNDNRIMVEARGIPAFFDFIGRSSPVACYNYKFELPEWRFEAKRMREVADELGCDYNRLSYLVKTGKVPCIRATDKGKPRFLPEHLPAIRQALES